jgi:hypothetical protein
MLDYLSRVLFAAIVSGLCFLGTYFWYIKNPIEDIGVDEAAQVAELASSENEVQRKPDTKVIWQVTTDNERLRLGDTIRTTSNAEALIAFLESDDQIELEPNSQVVLEELDGRLSLDFLKGNLVLRGSGKNFDIRSEGRKISYSGEVAIGKSANGMMDIQVFDGQATLQGGNLTSQVQKGKSALFDKAGKEQSQSTIQILQPEGRDAIYITPGENELTKIKWKPTAPGYQITLYTGESRDDLKKFSEKSYDGTTGELEVKIPVGKHYWQIVGTPADKAQPTLFSSVSRNQIIAKVPPVLIFPANLAKIVVSKKQKLTFRWGNPAKLNNLLLEVGQDPQLKNKVLSQALPPADFFESGIALPGVYYWRITGYLGRTKEPVPSPVVKFEMEEAGNLKAPKLLAPLAEASVPLSLVQEKGIYLKWDDVPGAKGYLVTANYKGQTKGLFNGDNSVQGEVKVTQYRLPGVDVGEFTWHVQSKGEGTQLSPPSKPQRFFVETVGEVLWADGKDKDLQIYKTLKPEFTAEWKPGPRTTSHYRVRWATQEQNIEERPWQEQKNTIFRSGLEKDGSVTIEVQALNAQKQVIARSVKRNISVEMEPLLPAPEFAESVPQLIQAAKNGSMNVSWKPIDGAKNYKVKILSKEGKAIKELDSQALKESVGGLLPGDYKVTVQAIDKRGRLGKENEGRALVVPKSSDVGAPKLKAIQVN